MLISANAAALPLPDESVQCVVTSPPYWGLRKYAGEQDVSWQEGEKFAYGLEPNIEMYVVHTVEILRDIRRVLRPDGVVFWNVGDSYAAAKGYSGELKASDKQATNKGSLRGPSVRPPNRNGHSGLKPKDLCLIPERVAIAAQADGWWIRSMIIWAKPNPMPESVTDRPTDAYEHILMLTKSERYFWDPEAVREPATGNTHSRGTGGGGPKAAARDSHEGWATATREAFDSRNLRNVWSFPTQPYSGAHFATFPEEIPRRCILAATSERGACIQCGAPWERVVSRSTETRVPSGWHQSGSERWAPQHVERFGEYEGKHVEADAQSPGRRMLKNLKASREAGNGDYFTPRKTVGWRPTCECRGQHGKTRPCLVLDPFGGSGTTGRVAIELRRQPILCDIAYARASQEDVEKGRSYSELADKRLRNVQVNLL